MSGAGTYVKRCGAAPEGYAAWEAAGLTWLGEATPAGGARVVRVRSVGGASLDLERLTVAPGGPTVEQAADFGRCLAATHRAGASAFGAGPPSWTGDGFLGPADEPLPLPLNPTQRWGEFYGEQRIRHTLRLGRDRGLWRGDDTATFEAVAQRLAEGEFDGTGVDLEPARLHGDLWSGNVLWTATGGVLIDPAAYGSHRETDLAMLALFGTPRLATILSAYDEVSPLTSGWRERIELHQLHPVMLHAVLFGGGYAARAVSIAHGYL